MRLALGAGRHLQFNRLNDSRFPATVSSFRLDTFEVTVGRFRAFVDAWPASKPKPGDGKHPKIPNSGWDLAWDKALPSSKEYFLGDSGALGCSYAIVNEPDPLAHLKDRTWTDVPRDKERMPMSCVSWHLAFAFCAWDAGRLPTEAENFFVRRAGAEQRAFPWGPSPASDARAILKDTPNGSQIGVGSRPDGRSKWGHHDLVGSRWEFLLDRALSSFPANLDLVVPCVDWVDVVHDDFFARRATGYGFQSDTSIQRGLTLDQELGEKGTDNAVDIRREWLGFRGARDVN